LKISSYKLKLHLYKAFAKHPNISWLLLKIGNYIYTLGLVDYLLLSGYPFFSLQSLACMGLGVPLFILLSMKIDKLFGR